MGFESVNETMMDKMTVKLQSGFSLVELATVLVIVGFLIGGLLVPLAAQIDASKRTETQKILDDIEEALYGFAAANGRLPCPASNGSNGLEDVGAATTFICDTTESPIATSGYYGFVPAVTLGINGTFNDDYLLLDAWGNPIRYNITSSDVDADDVADYVSVNEMAGVSMSALSSDLIVCIATPDATASNNSTACSSGEILSSNAVAVFYSLGPNGSSYITDPSDDELENAGEGATTELLGGYPIATDPVHVSHSRAEATDTDSGFDDLVRWISPMILYNRMIAAGQLP